MAKSSKRARSDGPAAALAASAPFPPTGRAAEDVPAAAVDFLKFVDESPSPFHATASAVRRLEADGFVRLSEAEPWVWGGNVKPQGRYYVTRNGTALFAFAVGGKFEPGNGFSLVAAHTDSPCLKTKPKSALRKSGFLSVGVQTYGGGLWSTWFDRDLSVAGRVVVRTSGSGGDGDGSLPKYATRLVHVKRPLMRVPTLAIHLDREVMTKGFVINKEEHLAPVLATEAMRRLGGGDGARGGAGAAAGPPSSAADAGAAAEGTCASSAHHPELVAVVAEELGVDPGQVEDFELCLFDTAAAAIGGVHREFIFAPRLDNLMSVYTGLRALTSSLTGGEAGSHDSGTPLELDTTVRALAAYDCEEVGSASLAGAASSMLREVMARLSGGADALPAAARRSVCISADMAHGVHPNYAGRHESEHKPALHGGLVIKTNANMRYATDAVSAHFVREAGRIAGVPVQEFVVKQDMACGSTIGPIVSTALGMRTVDVGLPQLSMHSIREMCGTDDVVHGTEIFRAFYSNFAAMDAALDKGEE